MADFLADLQKETKVQGSEAQGVLRSPEQPLEEESTGVVKQKEVYGEVKLPVSKEKDVMKEILEYKKEKEIERKEYKKPGQSDDSQQQDDADDSTVPDVPVKYYGYKVSNAAVESIPENIKANVNSSDTWLSVWLMRLLQMK